MLESDNGVMGGCYRQEHRPLERTEGFTVMIEGSVCMVNFERFIGSRVSEGSRRIAIEEVHATVLWW